MFWLRLLVVATIFAVGESGPVWSQGPRKLPGHGTSAVSALAFGLQGKLLVSAGKDNRIRLWEMATGKELAELETDPVYALAFSSDGKTFAGAGKTGEVRLYDALKREETLRLKGHQGPAAAVAFSPDGSTLASGGYDGTIRLWSVPKGQELRQFQVPKSRITALAFTPDGKHLLSGGTTRAVYSGNNTISTGQADLLRLWDVTGKEKVRELSTQGSCVALASTGKIAAGGGLVTTVRTTRFSTGYNGIDRIALVDLTTGREIQEIKARGAAVAFDPKGKFLATALGGLFAHLDGFGSMFGGGSRWDPRTRIWDLASGKEVLRLPANDVNVVLFSPEGKHLVTGSSKGEILVWDIEGEKRNPTPDPLEIVTVPPVEDKLLHLLHTEYEALLKRERNPDLLRRAAILFHQQNSFDALALVRTLRSPASIPLLLRYWMEEKSWEGLNFQDALVILTGQNFSTGPWELSVDAHGVPAREHVERLVKAWWLPNKDKISTALALMTAEQKRRIALQLLREPFRHREEYDPFSTVLHLYCGYVDPPDEENLWPTWWPQDLHGDMVPFLLESTGYADKPPPNRRDVFDVKFRVIPLLANLRKTGQAPLLHKIAADAKQPTATRLTCLLALHQVGEPLPAATLLTLLSKEKRLNNRLVLILSLKHGKPADTGPALIKFLDDPNRYIRLAALESLQTPQPVQALPRLKKMLAEGLPGCDAEMQATLTLLGEIGTPQGQEILAAFLRRCLNEPGMGDSLWYGLTAFERASRRRWVNPAHWSGAELRQDAQRALDWWTKQKVS